MRWEKFEDELICKFYMDHKSDWRDHLDLIMRKMRKINKARDIDAVTKRITDYRNLDLKEKSYEKVCRQVIDVYYELNPDLLVKSKSIYKTIELSLGMYLGIHKMVTLFEFFDDYAIVTIEHKAHKITNTNETLNYASLIGEIAELDLDHAKDEYIDTSSTDAMEWTITITYQDQTQKIIYGRNKYPKIFKRLLKISNLIDRHL